MYATQVALEARMIAQAWGIIRARRFSARRRSISSSRTRPSRWNWKPDVFLDISPVWEKKWAAIECMEGQEHLWHYYKNVAENRANHFMRNSGGQSGGRKADPCRRLPVGLPAHRG